MTVEIGHFALALALAFSLAQTGFGLVGNLRGNAAWMTLSASTASATFFLVLLAFLALCHAYLVSDFSVANVYQNSHTAKPTIYKLTGVWGNHEGSMLLWVLILVLFAALVARYGRQVSLSLRAATLGVQGAITSAFLLFILFTSNPFTRMTPPPFEGRDLNPILQDIGLAVHPPMLYVGYVGFSISFAFAVAALIVGRIDAVWARTVRPWVLIAWIFLTLGIAMGSYWAYYELGWGGFWFWDPVENASLMPWLAGTALLHSTLVMEKREALKVWTILLAILTFSLSLIGTFLVRSGVLTSVHAFASDPERGVFILGILLLTIGGSLSLFALRAGALRQGGIFAPISREAALVLNNLFLAAACAAVFVGTLYPLALETVTGAKISVGAPFFNLTVLPILVPLTLLIPLGQALPWKRGDLAAAMQRILTALVIAVVALLAVFGWTYGGPILAPLGIGLGAWVIAGTLADLSARAFRAGAPLSVNLRRLAGLPRAAFGTAVAHLGVGITIIGLAATAWDAETIATMRTGDRQTIAGYALRLDAVTPENGPNFRQDTAVLTVLRGDAELGRIVSAKRIYLARGMPTTEAGLMTRGFSQLYVSVGEVLKDRAIHVRLYHKPLVLLIWLGALVMAFGGLISLADRRMRIGAPQGRKAGTAVPVPAE